MTHSLTYKGRTVRISLTQEPATRHWIGEWKVVTQAAHEAVLHAESIQTPDAMTVEQEAMAKAATSARSWIDQHAACP